MTLNHAKQRKLHFTLSSVATSTIFDLLHLDIWGPYPITSMQDFVIFLLLLMITLVILGLSCCIINLKFIITLLISFLLLKIILKPPSKPFALIMVQNLLCLIFFASKGITHQTSCIETPQQNDIVE